MFNSLAIWRWFLLRQQYNLRPLAICLRSGVTIDCCNSSRSASLKLMGRGARVRQVHLTWIKLLWDTDCGATPTPQIYGELERDFVGSSNFLNKVAFLSTMLTLVATSGGAVIYSVKASLWRHYIYCSSPTNSICTRRLNQSVLVKKKSVEHIFGLVI